jgi:hypothetical protein
MNHPSLPPQAVPQAAARRRPAARWLAACTLALAVVAAAGIAAAEPPPDARHKTKASSFAPRHSNKSHSYGTPVGKPILHKQKKRPRPAAPAAAPIE